MKKRNSQNKENVLNFAQKYSYKWSHVSVKKYPPQKIPNE